MTKIVQRFKHIVTIITLFFVIITAFSGSAYSQGDVVAQSEAPPTLDELLSELAQPDAPNWRRLEDEIWALWSKSGSDSMDLLLERGRGALEAGDLEAAIDHLGALTDHAPDFAEGWNARAAAFFQHGDYGLALADLQRTLALNPKHFGALTGLGVILEELGKYDGARKALMQARAIHPHDPAIKQALERLDKALGATSL